VNYFVASADETLHDTWKLHPPLLPNGEQFPAAEMIDTDKFRDVQVYMPVAATGRKTDLTFIYWQLYVATDNGARKLSTLCRSPIWFSHAVTESGDALQILHAPLIADAIDMNQTLIVRHPEYPLRHPLSHMSGKIKTMTNIHLWQDAIASYDLFYLAERPLYLFISQRLLESLREAGVEGAGAAIYPQVYLS